VTSRCGRYSSRLQKQVVRSYWLRGGVGLGYKNLL
jgi:hypothetical protein